MINLSREIFRAYDIRGNASTQISNNICVKLGQGIGTILVNRDIHTVYVGRDARVSSSRISQNLIQGLISTGVSVINLGEISTPMLYFSLHEGDTTSGIMITGSHNPPEVNGFKIVINSIPFFDKDLVGLYDLIVAEKFLVGKGLEYPFYIDELYVNAVTNNILLTNPLKIVVDCGNSVVGNVIPKIFNRLRSCKAIILNREVDGEFPSHSPDISKKSNLIQLINKVVDCSADLGIAYDGDGDRVAIVDNFGNVVEVEHILMFLMSFIKNKNNKPIVHDVKCSSSLDTYATSKGIASYECKTGHVFIKEKIKEIDPIIAGEMSGHLFINDDRWYGFDDGIYSSVRFLEMLSNQQHTLHDIVATFPKIYSEEIEFSVLEIKKFEIANDIITEIRNLELNYSDIDGVKVFEDGGWWLIRPSNTSPCIILRITAQTPEKMAEIRNTALRLSKKWF